METNSMTYKDFMDFMNSIMKCDKKNFNCLDQQLLVNLIKPGCSELQKVKSLSSQTFTKYKSGAVSIGSLAQKISNWTSAKKLAKYLESLDKKPNSYEFYDGEIIRALTAKFELYNPATGGEYDNHYEACATELKKILVHESSNYSRKSRKHITKTEPSKRNNKEKSAQKESKEQATLEPPTETESERSIIQAPQVSKNPFSEYILDRIAENSKYYVETGVFREVLNLLKTSHKVLLIGDPGTGKTTVSEMIAQRFHTDGYELIFADEIEKAEEILAFIAQDKKRKELVILDDCFGQIYYKLVNSRQSNYIYRLIKKISDYPNKFLLLNSRVQIYNCAKNEDTSLSETLQSLCMEKLVFRTGSLTNFEKAKILINHLRINPAITKEYCKALLVNHKYKKILGHNNYTPRIMHYVSSSPFLDGTTPNLFIPKILNTLNNPLKIWDDEYRNKLQQRDRLLLTTLYSITDGSCRLEVCEKAYNKRIQNDPSIDKSLNNWEDALRILNGSMIEIYIVDKTQYIKVKNPSVNDYLKNNIMKPNSPEVQELKKTILYYCQIDRLYTNTGDSDTYKQQILQDKSYFNLIPLYPRNTTIDVVYEIAYKSILAPEYKKIISVFMENGAKSLPLFRVEPGFRICFNETEPNIGKSCVPEAVLSNLIKNPKTYKYYFEGVYTSFSILEFLKTSGYISYFWESITTISNEHPEIFNLENPQTREDLINAFNTQIKDNGAYFDVEDLIDSIISSLPNGIKLNEYDCRKKIENEMIKDRIEEIKSHTTDEYYCENTELEAFANNCIESFPFDYSDYIEEHLDAMENYIVDDEEESPVKQIVLESHYEDSQIEQAFEDLYNSKCSS